MNTSPEPSNRRTFLKTVAATGAGLALAQAAASAEKTAAPHKTRLGFDNFSVRALKFNAGQLIDYAASLQLDSLFLTDLDVYESFAPEYLAGLRKKAADHGLIIYAGSWSICPTSKSFKNKWGTAEEHLALGLRVAHALGSPVFRCILGVGDDRSSPGGIQARIVDMIKVCRSGRSQALDTGIKIAIENHAGDMQARELAALCEEAGRDYVGVTLDTGNSTWTMENPAQALEILAPYVVASALRDSMAWPDPGGATVQWTTMGEGVVNYKEFVPRFVELCPTVPVNVEVISGFPRHLPYFKKEFWQNWPQARAEDFAAFDQLVRAGHAIPPHHSANPQAEQDYQKKGLEDSLAYCKQTLGLGLK